MIDQALYQIILKDLDSNNMDLPTLSNVMSRSKSEKSLSKKIYPTKID